MVEQSEVALDKVTIMIEPCEDVPTDGATVDVAVRIRIPEGENG